MSSSDQMQKFVAFFKALADENRVKIIALLAHKPHSVEELAANLGVTSATVSHHIQRLVQADLVDGRVQQYYSVYTLKPETLRHMAGIFSTPEGIQAVTPNLDLNVYANKVRAEYFVRGRLKEFPNQLKKRELVLLRLAEEFEPGKRYSEKRVNEILKTFFPDVATLRRELVNHKLLVQAGGYYWRATEQQRI
ncbi:MAG: metalloregulator ArsR/SmtB family transcription factor [Chloroflexi bacterium]|nr:metalloregulator ArsR/SmtB family transcription factor [Chloroflexota bacterium]